MKKKNLSDKEIKKFIIDYSAEHKIKKFGKLEKFELKLSVNKNYYFKYSNI